ncbi:hypothetical protein BpHYR1_016381 [Brachionus plicatilis]|uniref:Uncharacterized protein n=1 Tax=Brachionus plicatilis TaxID=10195 RepID=A0A3M7SXC4_BRAPC|nr:hypothetical protein BpHYR1_016381 [Brachionus plicatilis]
MSKRKDKENLPNEISSKKSKIERPTRTKPHTATVQEVFLKKISTKIDSEPLTSSHLTEIVNTITRSSPLGKENNLLALFKKIVKKNEFNSDMFLGLLDQLRLDFLSKFKNICAFFLSNLLMIHSEPSTFDQKACSSTAEQFKIFQFRPVHFMALIKHSFSLVRIVNYSNQKYMKDKSLFTTAEKFLIQELSKRLELDKTGLISDEVLKAFKELIEKYPIDCVDNNFLIKLYFSITNLMNNDKAEKMSVELLKFLSNIFEIELESNKSKMVQKCLIKSVDMKNLLFLFNINVLTTFVPQEVLNIKLMSFCYKILDQYGTPINKNFEEPKSVNESFCLFVSKIFKEVFMYFV